MARKMDQQQAPSGMAGLVRYYDDDKSLVKLKPEHVIGIAIGMVILEIFLFTVF